MITEKRKSTTSLRLARHLFKNPYTTISSVARLLGVSYSGAKNAVNTLVYLGILVQTDTYSSSRIYLAKEIEDIMLSDASE